MNSVCFDNCVNKDCIILSLCFSSFFRYKICSWYSSLLFHQFVEWLLIGDYEKELLKMFISLIKKSLISLKTCSFKHSGSTYRSKLTTKFLCWVNDSLFWLDSTVSWMESTVSWLFSTVAWPSKNLQMFAFALSFLHDVAQTLLEEISVPDFRLYFF